MNVFDKDFKFDNPSESIQPQEDEIEGISESHDESHKSSESPTMKDISRGGSERGGLKSLIIDDVPSLQDGNEINLLIRQTNELTNLTNISLETEDF
jgi:hypothetical protein